MIKFNQLIKECTFNGMTIIAYDRAKKRDIIKLCKKRYEYELS